MDFQESKKEMNDDSEEKILEDWNRYNNPSGLYVNDGVISTRNKAYKPETDFESLYRTLEHFAKRHGSPERSVVKQNKSRNKQFNSMVYGANKQPMEFWIRAKKLKKIKKGLA